MAIINIPFTFSAGAVIIASQHNSNFSTIYGDYNGFIDNNNIVASAGIVYSKLTLTGGIVNADINASAAIADSKLAQITTASKVSGSAITGLASVPSGAGVLPAVNTSSRTSIFTSSGTFTAPTGVTQIFLTMQAGGGGGAGGDGGSNGGGGGASGQGIWMYPYTVISGNSYTVTINSGGGGGAQGVNGSTGGSVVFDTITMNGGGGGVNGSSTGNGGTVTIGVSSSLAASGNTGGGKGYYIIGQAGGNKVTSTGGGGAGSMLGAGGDGSTINANPGGTGTGYGSGGGGATSVTSSGGAGAPGIVIVTF